MKLSSTVAAALLLCAATSFVELRAQDRIVAFTGMRLIDGTPQAPTDNAVVLVTNGRVSAVGPAARVQIPSGAARVNLTGKTVVPGLINAHGHANDIDQMLPLYAKYGTTTVYSLGNDNNAAEALSVRDRQNDLKLPRARLLTSGKIITGTTPAAARAEVQANAQARVDVIKIRVEDNFGTTPKMTPEVYRAIIDEAHKNRLRVAAHLFYLADAKSLLDAGVDLIAHSVRDREVDQALIGTLRAKNVCLVPTLTRDLSTFVYESTPAFFTDPLFLQYADPKDIATLKEPARQKALGANPTTPRNKAGYEMAGRNLKILADAGVKIAMGTDSGAGVGRFPGYFELVELDLMARAGLSPRQVLTSATADAASCIGQADTLGTLTTGKWADLLVLDGNPLDDVANFRKISAVYVGGQQVPR